MMGLLDALASMGERDEARRLVERGGAWTSDPRAPLHLARATASLDPAKGVEAMQALLRGSHHPELRRRAGFEAAGLLDRMQRFREAFDAAREAHAVAPERPDAIAEVIRTAEELLARLETGTPWFELAPRASMESR